MSIAKRQELLIDLCERLTDHVAIDHLIWQGWLLQMAYTKLQ